MRIACLVALGLFVSATLSCEEPSVGPGEADGTAESDGADGETGDVP